MPLQMNSAAVHQQGVLVGVFVMGWCVCEAGKGHILPLEAGEGHILPLEGGEGRILPLEAVPVHPTFPIPRTL